MNPAIFAQMATGPMSWSFVQILIGIIVIAACVGIMYIALRQFGVQIPPFVVQIFWIVVCAFIAILAIRMILSM